MFAAHEADAAGAVRGPLPTRAAALDALRGLAILTMALSGMIPFGVQADGTHLPAWMYHAQVPPPAHKFNPDLPGLTWVDLVFPFFLFSMGAAIPLALSARLARGVSRWHLAGHSLRRGLLLLIFALYVDHIVPAKIQSPPDSRTWWLGLLGFALLFLALTRLPAQWPGRLRALVRILGGAGMVAFVVLTRYRDGGGLSLAWHDFDAILADINRVAARSDIIIVVLANTVVTGSLIWLVTRHEPALRLGFMLAVIGVRLAHVPDGWVQAVWNWTPVPALYRLYFQQYLLIVLPGTLVGDLLLEWQQACQAGVARSPTQADPVPWSRVRFLGIVLLMPALSILICAGLQARWLPWTTFCAAALCAAGACLFRRPADAPARLLRRLYTWGVLWLMVGLVFEAYEGGIKKDRPTMSYYFVTSGLAIFALVFFTVLIEVFRAGRWLWLLIDSGQNPMIAYAGVRNFVAPVFHLTGLEAWLGRVLATPWLGVLRGLIKTLALSAAVSICTRLRVYWRT